MIKDITQVLSNQKVENNHGVSLKVAKAIFGVSTAEMAREFSVYPSAIDKFCKTKKFNAERLAQIAEFFGMSVDSFESLAHRALSESVASDMDSLLDHLRERHGNFSSQIKQIERHYAKIIECIQHIEGVR